MFQMPEILLFDIFEPQSADGVSTGGAYPSRIRWVIVLPRENFKKYTQNESISCNFIIYMDRDLGKPGLMTIFFHFSTFSISDIFYDLNAKRTMSLTLLIA